MAKVDYLIVGQGLAGSCLALSLLERGKRILVADISDDHSASRVAAGMFNPITSKVRATTWNAEVLFPFLHTFYQNAETITKRRFYHPLPMYRPFPSDEDQKGWNDVTTVYLKELHLRSRYPQFVRDPFGGLELNHAGYVDTKTFVEVVKDHLHSLNCWLEMSGTFLVNEDFLDRCQEIAARVIFCEGVRVSENPFFKWLPINRLKGEVLDVQVDLPKDIIFNRSVYLVPGANGFRAGSTYDRSGEEGNSTRGILDIEQRLRTLLFVDFTTTGSDWGFRPVVRDRRPILGEHPERKGVFIFNGLGTKGVSLAPWSAKCLSGWMEGIESLPDELNISRFYPLYFKYLQDSQ